MKKAVFSNPTIPLSIRALLLCIAIASLPPLSANPIGEQIVAGSATFDRQPHSVTISTSDRTIIHWQDFSIGSDEITRFIQPNSTSAVLNRVMTGNPSTLLGRLMANGEVFLINPNGILIGRDAHIDTASFIASTFDVSNDEFMKGGDLHLTGDSQAMIRNQGRIQATGGDVILSAYQVVNEGDILASKGTVSLTAGQILLQQEHDSHFIISPLPTKSSGGIIQHGTIESTIAQLQSVGGNVYALAINQDGVIRATGSRNVQGRILLVAESGDIQQSGTLEANSVEPGKIQIASRSGSTLLTDAILTASGVDQGGNITLLGDQIGLFGNTVLNVQGLKGGGTLLIGGDAHGYTVSGHANAERIFVGSDAKIFANALDSGSGGKVVLWSEYQTHFDGSIESRGGKLDGNGGWIEVSGRDHLSFNGRIDVSAPLGEMGNILFDPQDLIIQASGTRNDLLDGNAFLFSEPNTTGNATVSASAIENLIGSITLQASRDLKVNASLNLVHLSSGQSATFQAGRNLIVNQSIVSQGGSLTFIASDGGGVHAANGRITVGAPIGNDQTGSITFLNDGTGGLVINKAITTGGDLIIQTPNANITDKAILTVAGNAKFNAGSKNITLDFAGHQFGSVQLTGKNVVLKESDATLLNSSTIAGNLTLTSGGDITGEGTLQVTGTTILNAVGHDIILNDSLSTFGTFKLNARHATLVDQGAVNLGASTLTGNLTLQSGGDITDSGNIVVGGILDFDASGHAITLNSSKNKFGSIRIQGSEVFIMESDASDLGHSIVTGNFSLTSLGDITDSGKLTLAGVTTLIAKNKSILLNETESNFGTMILTAKDVTLFESSDTDLGVSVLTGGLNITSLGDITDSGRLRVTGIVTLNAGTHNILLDTVDSTFGTLQLKGRDATIIEKSNMDLGDSTLSGTLTLRNTAGKVTQSGVIRASILDLTSVGTITLGLNNEVDFISGLTSRGNLTFKDATGNLTVQNPISTSNRGNLTLQAAGGDLVLQSTVSGKTVTLVSENNFINQAGASPITSSTRFLVYSTHPSLNNLGGMLATKEEFETSFPTLPSQSGNVFLYSAPFLLPPPATTPVEAGLTTTIFTLPDVSIPIETRFNRNLIPVSQISDSLTTLGYTAENFQGPNLMNGATVGNSLLEPFASLRY